MFSYKLLTNHAGILLCGDYNTLKSLQEVVHEVNEKSVLIRDKEGSFLGLAYDARKACEGQRQVLKPPAHMPEIGVRYGVEILWPVLMVQCRMLRASLAYFDSSKRQQAITYALEDVIEGAIDEVFGSDAKVIQDRWYRIDPSHPWPEEKLSSRGAQFCMWTGAKRRANFAGLLASFDPMYSFTYQHMLENGEVGLVAPEDLDALEDVEWQDPKW
jgi:hypothetical protein